MKLAIIPARGGSKRIPHKNIRDFCGKPIIAWSIEAALESGCFDRIIVSTDDTEIADVAQKWGAEVPFLRPEELSDDYVGTAAVIRHAVEWFIERGVCFEHVCCIYATAPFMTPDDIQSGLETMLTSGSEYAFSVTRFGYPIQRAVRITDKKRLEMFYPNYFSSRSQDLEEAYHDAGQFYWGTVEAWLKEKPMFSEIASPVVLPRYRVQDIDTLEDWIRAELMFKILRQSRERIT